MLAQFYPPIVGGEEHAVAALATELAGRGHDVAVATMHHPGLPEREDDGGVRVHRVRGAAARLPFLHSGARLHAPPAPDPVLARQLRRVVALERPDVVHAHNWIVHSYLPVKGRSEAPLVLSLHDYSLVCSTKRLMRDGAPCSGPGPVRCPVCAGRHYGALKGPAVATMLAATALPAAALVDAYVAVSEAVAQRTGLPRRRTPHEVIPNFFTPAPAPETPLGARLPAGDFVLFAGDVSHDKGAGVLLRALGGAQPSPMPLVLIGRQLLGTDPRSLPEHVVRLDPVDRASVLEAFGRCAIAVVPSIWPEPFGLVALEAMAMGKPVIAARSGALPDVVVDGETGLLVEPGDAAALRDAIMRLVADPQLRARLGDAGRRRVATHFSADVVVPRYERLYATTIARRRRYG